jgi:hypothetical protein
LPITHHHTGNSLASFIPYHRISHLPPIQEKEEARGCPPKDSWSVHIRHITYVSSPSLFVGCLHSCSPYLECWFMGYLSPWVEWPQQLALSGGYLILCALFLMFHVFL